MKVVGGVAPLMVMHVYYITDSRDGGPAVHWVAMVFVCVFWTTARVGRSVENGEQEQGLLGLGGWRVWEGMEVWRWLPGGWELGGHGCREGRGVAAGRVAGVSAGRAGRGTH